MSPAAVRQAFSALAEAWSEAVALPEGWTLIRLERTGIQVEYVGGRSEYVTWWEATAKGPNDAEQVSRGGFAVHALFELVKALDPTNTDPAWPA